MVGTEMEAKLGLLLSLLSGLGDGAPVTERAIL